MTVNELIAKLESHSNKDNIVFIRTKLDTASNCNGTNVTTELCIESYTGLDNELDYVTVMSEVY